MVVDANGRDEIEGARRKRKFARMFLLMHDERASAGKHPRGRIATGGLGETSPGQFQEFAPPATHVEPSHRFCLSLTAAKQPI
jgi:hypothetical protein